MMWQKCWKIPATFKKNDCIYCTARYPLQLLSLTFRDFAMSHLPENLYYAQTHEWAKQEDDNLVRIGISDFAQTELGDLMYLDLPEVGKHFEAGDPCATVESVKAASELLAPVSGKVVAINSAVIDEPELVNDDPYENWLFCIQADDIGELDELMDSVAYSQIILD